MNKLKNCPFCGSSNVKNYNLLGNDTDYAVACRNCGAEGPDKETEPEAIKAWNTRSGWVSVDDRLPESIGSYLVHHKDKQLDIIAWAFYTSEKKWAGNNEFYKKVTHWMPLPAPPEVEG